MYDPTDTRQQEADAKERAEIERQRTRQAGEDLRQVMKSVAGRRYVRRMLDATGVFRPSFNNSGSITAFNEGQRYVGLMLLAEVKQHCPKEFITLLQEDSNG